MELAEISNRIDVRLNSFNKGISVDEYEKSLYLTRAQKDIYYELLKEFEQTGIITNMLKPFVVNVNISPGLTGTNPEDIISGAQYFALPDGVEKIIYETATLDVAGNPLLDGRVTRVIATKAAEMVLKKDNPFKTPDKTETLRIIAIKTSTDNVVELHAIANIGTYSIKYFKTILPIVLESLPDSLTVDDVSAETNTEFNDDVLKTIIERTVMYILQDNSIQKQNV